MQLQINCRQRWRISEYMRSSHHHPTGRQCKLPSIIFYATWH